MDFYNTLIIDGLQFFKTSNEQLLIRLYAVLPTLVRELEYVFAVRHQVLLFYQAVDDAAGKVPLPVQFLFYRRNACLARFVFAAFVVI